MEIVYFIIDIFKWIIDLFKKGFEGALEKFIEINLFEKLIIINIIMAFFAIVLPVANHLIFNLTFSVNNPLAVYLVGIVIVMIITIYFPGLSSLVVRIVINAYYYFWVMYIHYGQGIIKTDYELRAGYYFNIAVPLVYIFLSALSYMAEKRR